jgi:N-methylhydantoinase A
VLIPPAPGVLCADGLLAADLKAEFSRTLPKAGPIDVAAAETIFAELSAQADAWLAAEEVAAADRGQARVALMRYHGQGGEIAVPWPGSADAAETAFGAAHETLYGFRLEAPIELVTLRVEATGRMPPPPRPQLAPGSGIEAQAEAVVQFAGGPAAVPLLDRTLFGAGDRFTGPAIISQLDATTLVAPGWTGEVHASGAILLTRGSKAKESGRE